LPVRASPLPCVKLDPEALLNTSFRVSAFVALLISGCMGADAAPPIASQSSEIQGGTTDSTDTFSIGIVQTEDIQDDMVAYCTGVMLGPNLVATARHCVAELSSTTIDCSTSVFGSLYPASDLYLTTATTIDPQTVTACVARPADCPYNNSVTTIIVPSGAGEDTVCGNDIALLILGDPISLPQYVVPTINPPMTSSQYETTVTAIGYGVTTPTDTSGSTAGTRRIKENVALQCIPDDPNPSESALNCYTQNTQPPPQSFLTASEFMSGDSTCEGDSGSGAFEQSNFNAGKWVAFGVLSRGGTNGTPGTTCIQPIYSRFDAWGSMLASAATQAASQGGYSVPAWAMNLDAGTGQSPSSEAGSSGNSSGGTSSSGGSSGAGGSSGGAIDGTPCEDGSMCVSGICASATSMSEGVCVSGCVDGGCSGEFACQSGYCFPGTTDASLAVSSSPHGAAGCSVTAAPAPMPSSPAFLGGIGLAAVGLRRRRGRRRGSSVSAS
jgi:MYXO-CTERM domain-containing protein